MATSAGKNVKYGSAARTYVSVSVTARHTARIKRMNEAEIGIQLIPLLASCAQSTVVH